MVVLVVDVANVMGSRPDGWWRDRPGAATRLLDELGALVGRFLEPGVVIDRVVAVLEGASRSARVPTGVEVVSAPADGDSEIVRFVRGLTEQDCVERGFAEQGLAEQGLAGQGPGEHGPVGPVVVVTADRGLRARLPDGVQVCGPRRMLDLLAG